MSDSKDTRIYTLRNKKLKPSTIAEIAKYTHGLIRNSMTSIIMKGSSNPDDSYSILLLQILDTMKKLNSKVNKLDARVRLSYKDNTDFQGNDFTFQRPYNYNEKYNSSSSNDKPKFGEENEKEESPLIKVNTKRKNKKNKNKNKKSEIIQEKRPLLMSTVKGNEWDEDLVGAIQLNIRKCFGQYILSYQEEGLILSKLSNQQFENFYELAASVNNELEVLNMDKIKSIPPDFDIDEYNIRVDHLICKWTQTEYL